jgi:hypothetical protein
VRFDGVEGGFGVVEAVFAGLQVVGGGGMGGEVLFGLGGEVAGFELFLLAGLECLRFDAGGVGRGFVAVAGVAGFTGHGGPSGGW